MTACYAGVITHADAEQPCEPVYADDPGLCAARMFDGELPGLERIGKLALVPSSRIVQSGVSMGFECLDRRMFDPGKCYDKLAETGTKWARCQTGWSRCEMQRGSYDFAWLDDVVTNLLSRGVQPWFNVGYGNKLYMTNVYTEAAVGCVPFYYGAVCEKAWEDYIHALAHRYKNKVECWEIWNEPDIGHFWQPRKPDPKEYLRLVKWTGDLIRGEIPNAKIGACTSRIYNEFTKAFIEAGAGDAIDFFCVHAYEVIPENGFAENISKIRRLFDANDGRHVKIWQGEAGFASWFPPDHWLKPTVRESEANQAKWLLRRFMTDARAGCERSSFFQMTDMTARPYSMAHTTQKNPARHGILRGGSYERKLSFFALGHYNALFDGETKLASHLTVTVDVKDAVAPSTKKVAEPAAFGYLRQGCPLLIYYLPIDVQSGYPGLKTCVVAVKGPQLKAFREPVMVDLLKGGVYSIKRIEMLAAGVRFFDVPLTDYPLVITERSLLEGRYEGIH